MIPGISAKANAYYLQNPVAYTQDFIKLKGKPLYPYAYQQPILNTLPSMEPDLKNQLRCMAVLGARQIFGKSTTGSMIATWFAPLHANTNTTIISHRQRRSDKMLANIKRYMREQPLLLDMTKKGNNPDLVWSASEIELTNGSFITSLPEGNDADSAVGDTTNLVIIDEVARFKNPNSIKGSIMPTLFESFGIIIMLSSSWGRGGRGEYWYEVVNNPDYMVFQTNAEEALRIQYKRNVMMIGEQKSREVLGKKLEWLKFQKRELGSYLYEMQYMNSFEYGLDSAFEQRDLDSCFTDVPQLIEPEPMHIYISTVDFGKSVKTGDRTAVSIYDITNIDEIWCVYRKAYSLLYTEVLPKIVEPSVTFNVQEIYCDLGGGEKQVEDLNNDDTLERMGIKTTGVIFSGGLKRTTSDFEDKGIIRKTISKYQCGNRLVSYIENHNISYCRDCMRSEYDDYLVVQTPGGSRTYSHPPNGHDDAIDTDIILMGIISEMSVNYGNSGYDAMAMPVGSIHGGVNHCERDSIVVM